MRTARHLPFSLRRALPFKVAPVVFRPAAEVATADRAFNGWLEGIKRQARDNLESGESTRIAWSVRFKTPRYPSVDDYTLEELLLELWEQFYFETPDSVELKGITKRRNPQTGYTYYVTGDPLLDQFEEAFGRGERPDMSILDGPGGGPDVFREPVFVHDKAGPGFAPGQAFAPEQGLQGVRETADGAKITAGGAKVTHTDFSNDDWIKAKLGDDDVLKALASKLSGGS